MSLFNTQRISCPACGLEQDFETVLSVNGAGRPDLIEAILDDDFQRKPCQRCAAPLRLDPDFTLLDQARGLWLSAAPLAGLARWPEFEARAQQAFAEGYSASPSQGAREIGATLRARVSFGWPAAREKLLIAELGLNDVSIELCKMAALRSGAPAHLQASTELRLLGVEGEDLVLAWVDSASGETGAELRLARSLYEQIEGDDTSAWDRLRKPMSSGYFVDINRMLLPPPPKA